VTYRQVAVISIVSTAVALAGALWTGSAQAEFSPKTFSCSETPESLTYYVGQSSCLSSARPGVAAFRAMVLAAFPSTGDLGIMRGCNVGGASEHKEGRAWDWAVNAYSPSQKAIADGFLAQLLETDDCGNDYALVRRFGIMYMIWNDKIWRAYRPWQGWAQYTGSNHHTDHVHFSFSWDGANQDTTYWTEGAAPPEEETQPVCESAPVAGGAGQPFEDMPVGSFGHDEAIALLDAGITHGCSSDPPLFCPNCRAARYQAVVFVLRAMGADVSNPPAQSSFTDVPKSKWYWPYVEKAKALGLTHGCSATEFCPDGPTTRAQMAKFIVEGAGWALSNPSTATFGDVAKGSTFYKHIETLKVMCVTSGCGDGSNFCPSTEITRVQAAMFVARAFDLDNSNGCISYCDPALCNEGVQCGGWGACGGFASACDESGTQTRECDDFDDCSSTSLDPTCGVFGTSESRNCTRDTDGTVVEGWSAWSACSGFSDACDTTGTRTRTRSVCSGGSATTEQATGDCTREVSGCDEPDVIDDVGPEDIAEDQDVVVTEDITTPEDAAAADVMESDTSLVDVPSIPDSSEPEDGAPTHDGALDEVALSDSHHPSNDVSTSVDLAVRRGDGGCASAPLPTAWFLVLAPFFLLTGVRRFGRRADRGSDGNDGD